MKQPHHKGVSGREACNCHAWCTRLLDALLPGGEPPRILCPNVLQPQSSQLT
eukprot:CAMPEP_0179125224 /NCGR_PEP_ID=MMETSP0796-20121207/59211_1 /TAXON_ID=73915 /ORGANISM="Pyrodinium bahamense, Strain pbaha01" /LENGTH=51 /DNA_ID=CAMNT_0020823911 /DNA_START=91 /DNA_END=243 /DNA_ORIENTATION=-